jgi:hypothetical protein
MYKNSIKIFIATVSIFIITACGGGGTSEPTGGNQEPTPAVSMEIGKTYTMKKGQTIVRKEEPTQIVVHTDITSGESTAKLISGAATIE